MLKSEYSHETAIVQQKIEEIPKEIELKKGILENIRKDKKTAEKIQELALSERGNPKYAVVSKEAVNAHLLKMAREKSANPEKEIKPVNINGFEVSVNYDRHRDEVRFTVKGEYTYSCVAGTAEKQDNYQRIKNLFENGIPKMEQAVSDDISKLESDFKQAEKRVAEPFSKEHELEEKVEEFEELEKKLSGISQQEDDVIDPEEEPTVETAEEMAEREKIYSVDEDDFQPTDNNDENNANTNNVRR